MKLKKRPEQKDSDVHRLYKWQQMLTKPVVDCQLGRLYNKEAVIGRGGVMDMS